MTRWIWNSLDKSRTFVNVTLDAEELISVCQGNSSQDVRAITKLYLDGRQTQTHGYLLGW